MALSIGGSEMNQNQIRAALVRCGVAIDARSPIWLLLAVVAGPHSWLHSGGSTPWRERRRTEAIAILAEAGITA